MLKAFVALLSGILLVAATSFTLAQSLINGTITKIDQAKGTIQLRFAQPSAIGGVPTDTNEEFKVREGLGFGALKPGDKVEFLVKDVDGKKTITDLHKQ